jgi:hypothetical protein
MRRKPLLGLAESLAICSRRIRDAGVIARLNTAKSSEGFTDKVQQERRSGAGRTTN